MDFCDIKPFQSKVHFAATIVLSSIGGAADWQGDKLGEFVKAGEHEGRPYYRQRDTEGNPETFLYSAGGKWWVWEKLGQSTGALKNEQNSPEPPSNGWLYQRGGYADDDTSLALKFTALSPLPLGKVSGEGDMVRKLRGSLGDYRFFGRRNLPRSD